MSDAAVSEATKVEVSKAAEIVNLVLNPPHSDTAMRKDIEPPLGPRV